MNIIKKSLFAGLLISLFAAPVFANTMNTNNINKKHMYFDFGMGIGTAKDWNTNSLSLNAMTMGVYLNKNLGVEIGMDSLPNGGNDAGQAMIMSYHLAAKGVLPVATFASLYGKLGVGVNGNEGEAEKNKPMGMMKMSMDNASSIGAYIAAGVLFHINDTFSLYTEASGVAIPKFLDNIGRDESSNYKGFGSSYMATAGLEVRL